MKVLYGGGFSEADLSLFTSIIKSRVVVVLQNLINGAQELKIRTSKDIKVGRKILFYSFFSFLFSLHVMQLWQHQI